jgi:hypothetical protein
VKEWLSKIRICGFFDLFRNASTAFASSAKEFCRFEISEGVGSVRSIQRL